MTVMSGRWVPPNSGWLETMTSPFLSLPFQISAWVRTQVDILPKWTGRWGAVMRWLVRFYIKEGRKMRRGFCVPLATSPPVESKRAQE